MKLVIMGEPVAAGRPRFSSRGGFVKAYDPKKSRDYKKLIKKQTMQQLPSGYEPFACPIEVDIKVYRSIQKSVSKKSMLDGSQMTLDRQSNLTRIITSKSS